MEGSGRIVGSVVNSVVETSCSGGAEVGSGGSLCGSDVWCGISSSLQVRFYQKGSKTFPKLTSENLQNMWLEDGCLAGVHI